MFLFEQDIFTLPSSLFTSVLALLTLRIIFKKKSAGIRGSLQIFVKESSETFVSSVKQICSSYRYSKNLDDNIWVGKVSWFLLITCTFVYFNGYRYCSNFKTPNLHVFEYFAIILCISRNPKALSPQNNNIYLLQSYWSVLIYKICREWSTSTNCIITLNQFTNLDLIVNSHWHNPNDMLCTGLIGDRMYSIYERQKREHF